jgi:hypothetical protein
LPHHGGERADCRRAPARGESFKADRTTVIERIKKLVHEGNVRRLIVKHEERTIAEFPLTAGVVGAVLAPVVAAIAAIVALIEECTIHVERETTAPASEAAGGKAMDSGQTRVA